MKAMSGPVRETGALSNLPDATKGEVWIRVAEPGSGNAVFGRLAGDAVILVDGTPFGEWRENGRRVTVTDARILAPVAPSTFYACGINYVGHAEACSAEFDRPLESFLPARPEVGYRAQSAIIAPGDRIVIPADAPANVQCEGELGVVIGKPARKVRAADALDYVLGYTICNDVSVRDWQFWAQTFTIGKSFDTHCPFGPWIVTPDEVGDPHALALKTWVNGELRQDSNTKHLVFDCYTQIETLTKAFTLEPGDLVLTGTPSGVGIGYKPHKYLKLGDRVKIEIEKLGCIENEVVAEPASTTLI